MKRAIVVSLLALSVISCSENAGKNPGELSTSEIIASLQKENAELRARVSDLQQTPSALLAEVSAKANAGDISGAEKVLNQLTSKYPNSVEVSAATAAVADVKKQAEIKKAEMDRLAAEGFRGLKATPTFEAIDAEVRLRSAKTASQWVTDSYGNEWHYREAEKGSKYVTAKVDVVSKLKDPKLPGIGVYAVEGNVLKLLGLMDYGFARWDDYGTYLGNYADYRNDFSHSSSIPFSLGLSVENERLSSQVYLIATQEGCYTRTTERFRNPPVWYYSSSCNSLKPELSVSDFTDGKLSVLKRL